MILRVEKIGHEFQVKSPKVTCLHNVNLTIKPGEFCCIAGKSGCGKSTLLNIITGMLSPAYGDVYINKDNIYHDWNEKQRTKIRSKEIGYMMQGASLLDNLTVFENVICPLELSGKKVDFKKVKKLLKELFIENIRDSYPSELSGGEYRRVSLARALMPSPKLLVVDEPTTSLDKQSAQIVRKLITSYCDCENSVLVATHDQWIMEQADHLLIL